jgi:hypothetical protein
MRARGGKGSEDERSRFSRHGGKVAVAHQGVMELELLATPTEPRIANSD